METDVVGSQFAPETSANSAMSWNDYWDREIRKQNGGAYVTGSPDYWLNKFFNFFTGDYDRIAAGYDAYLTNNQRQYEQQNINDARRAIRCRTRLNTCRTNTILKS